MYFLASTKLAVQFQGNAKPPIAAYSYVGLNSSI